MAALLVIDVQQYFLNKHTQDLPSKIANFVEKQQYDSVLFFQFINQPESNFVKIHNWQHMFGSPEADIAQELQPLLTKENVFPKYGFSVFGADGFSEYLESHQINTLHLCGMDTDACILSSEMDAFERGYDTRVIEDLCASHWGREYHQKAVDLMKKNLGKQAVILSTEC